LWYFLIVNLGRKLQATMTQFLRLRVKPFSGEWFEDLFALFKVTTAPKVILCTSYLLGCTRTDFFGSYYRLM